MTRYLTIRGAPDYSKSSAAGPLVEFLASLPELRQVGPVAFREAGDRPFVSVIMAASDSSGSYASTGRFIRQVNVVELICSDDCDPTWHDELAASIAARLGWAVYDDHDS